MPVRGAQCVALPKLRPERVVGNALQKHLSQRTQQPDICVTAPTYGVSSPRAICKDGKALQLIQKQRMSEQPPAVPNNHLERNVALNRVIRVHRYAIERLVQPR